MRDCLNSTVLSDLPYHDTANSALNCMLGLLCYCVPPIQPLSADHIDIRSEWGMLLHQILIAYPIPSPKRAPIER